MFLKITTKEGHFEAENLQKIRILNLNKILLVLTKKV